MNYISKLKLYVILSALLCVGCSNIDAAPEQYSFGCLPGRQSVPCIVSTKLHEPVGAVTVVYDTGTDSTPLDREFFASHAEPDGTNPALIEYAAAYLALWQDEAARVYNELYGDAGADMFAALTDEIERDADEYLQEFAVGDGEHYGREATFMTMWQKALAYRRAAGEPPRA